MNILSILANYAVQKEIGTYDPYSDLDRLLRSVSTTQVSSYRAAVNELRQKRFKYDAIITSFSPDDLLDHWDKAIYPRSLQGHSFPNELRGYSKAYDVVSDILVENPFSVVVVYSGARPAVAAAIQSAFSERIHWVDKVGRITDWVRIERANLQEAIIRGLTEYHIILDQTDTFHISQSVSRGPVHLATASSVQNILVKPHFGSTRLVYANQLHEFEYLINKPKPSEREIHLFLESHPEVLLGNRYKAFRSHVHLHREDDNKGPLIPDFMLEPLSPTDFWKVLDLKLPSDKIVFELNDNRKGFGAKVLAALRQLREYRAYFDNPRYRQRLADIGITAFKPEISVIIGRDYGGLSCEEIVRARRDLPGLEVMTYTELLARMRAMAWLYQ